MSMMMVEASISESWVQCRRSREILDQYPLRVQRKTSQQGVMAVTQPASATVKGKNRHGLGLFPEWPTGKIGLMDNPKACASRSQRVCGGDAPGARTSPAAVTSISTVSLT